VSIVGAALVLVGGAGTVWGVLASTTQRRPLDLVAAIVAPLSLLVALAGGVLIFVPGFFG
jgi:hypothetical protein